MRYSKLFLPTLREAPSDADIISAKLMFRAGMIRKVASGIYEWLPIGLKVLKKVENIIREEMNSIDGNEVLFPIMLPKELWEETGRWTIYGKELFRISDRKDSLFCLGPTHEEAVTALARNEIRSYRQLPMMLYQFGTKFRDEIRPRFGVMRAREFYMKDAYSFHTDEKNADDYYKIVFDAYKRICARCGFIFRAVEATSGAIGGSFSHEFMVIADTGEEEIVFCDCGYGANTEKAVFKTTKEVSSSDKMDVLKEVHTPGVGSVASVSKLIGKREDNFIKTLIYVVDGTPVIALVRGDCEINENKLQSLLGANEVVLAKDNVIEEVSGAARGFAGPVGLKKQVKIVADNAINSMLNAVSGANKTDYHLTNINFGRDFAADTVADIRKVKHNDHCATCGKELKFCRGIEVGHTFKLGTKYSKAMNAQYLNKEGKETVSVMGCYGIGVSRIVAATIEQSHDENGIKWPIALAPFEVVVIPVNIDEPKTAEVAETLYKNLQKLGVDVLIDDRAERAGVKFKDADLVGISIKIVVSEKNLKDDKIEIKLRHSGEVMLVPSQDAIATILKLKNKLLQVQ